MVTRSSKLILIDAVRKTESHNRRKEEREMWLQRKKEKDKGRSSRQWSRSPSSYDSYHLDNLPPKRKVNKWAAELMKYEESLGDERWGHGGYKELYPDEFVSSSCESCGEPTNKQARQNGESSNQMITKKRKEKKSKKRKRERSNDSSASNASLDQPRKKKKKKEKRQRESPHGDESSDADSERRSNPFYRSYYLEKLTYSKDKCMHNGKQKDRRNGKHKDRHSDKHKDRRNDKKHKKKSKHKKEQK